MLDLNKTLEMNDTEVRVGQMRPELRDRIKNLHQTHQQDVAKVREARYHPDKERELLGGLQTTLRTAVEQACDADVKADEQAIAQDIAAVERLARLEPEPIPPSKLLTEHEKRELLQWHRERMNREQGLVTMHLAALATCKSPAGLLDQFQRVLLVTEHPALLDLANAAIRERLTALVDDVPVRIQKTNTAWRAPFDQVMKDLDKEIVKLANRGIRIQSLAKVRADLDRRKEILATIAAERKNNQLIRLGLTSNNVMGNMTVGAALDKNRRPVAATPTEPAPGAVVLGSAFKKRA